MAIVKGEFYDAVVLSAEWDEHNEKLFLRVKCDVCGEELEGRVYATANTTKPKLQDDGSEGPSMLEEQLAALGFDGEKSQAINIGASGIDLTGNPTRIKADEYNGKIRIGAFYRLARKVDMDRLADILGAPKPSLGDESFEASEDIPF